MQGQMYVPQLSKVNKTIIIVYVALFILSSVAGAILKVPIGGYLTLTSLGQFSVLNILQVITFPFVDHALMSVVFNGLILWFIGSELEQKWGAKFYLKFLALSAYSAGVVFFILMSVGVLGAGASLYGLSGVNLALLVAYGIIYSERTMIFMFLFPMKAKYFCMLLAGIEVFMAFSGGAFNNAWGHLIAMGVGTAYLKYQSLKARGLGLGNIMDNHRSHQARKKRGNLKLVKTEEERPNPEDPKYWQ